MEPAVSRRRRNILISCFVILWAGLFHYETLRLNYLSPLIGHPLPKTKFLYPPAGWIMFFNVGRSYGYAEVYGVRQGRPELIDPHEIFRTRFVWYDNIRRNVLISVLSPQAARTFCPYLAHRFPQYEGFAVVYSQYDDVTDPSAEPRRGVAYRCP